MPPGQDQNTTSGHNSDESDSRQSSAASSTAGFSRPNAPRRVRFPLDNRIYYPEDGSGRESLRTSRYSNPSPRNSSPLSSPPMINDEEDYFTAKPQSSNSSPTMMVTRPDNSRVDPIDDNDDEDDDESTNDSTRHLIPSPPPPAAQSSNNSLHPGAAASMAVGANSLQNLFDVGLHTSGGLAPGASEHDQHLREQGVIDENEQNAGDEFTRRRASVLKRLESLRHRHSELSQSLTDDEAENGPYGQGRGSNDVPLTELDQKLKQIQEEQEEANEMARNLVRNHTLHHKHTPSSDDNSINMNNNQDGGMNDEKQAADGDGESHKSHKKDDTSYLVKNDDFITAQNDYDTYGYNQNDGDLPPPIDEAQNQRHHEDYVAPPSKVRQGVLGSLLKLYGDAESEKSSATLAESQHSTPTNSEPPTPHRRGSHGELSSADATSKSARPKLFKNHSSSSIFTTSHGQHKDKRPKWYQHKSSRSTTSLGGLVVSSAQTLAAPGTNGAESPVKPTKKFAKKINHKKHKQKMKLEEQLRITVHIADVLQRQRFIIRMCRALLLYGAPTHRLEEYMKMTARVLEINCQFLYIPGCMIISFDDATTHTSDMQLVRCVQGLNLAKLHVAHQIYKEVVHDVISVEEASQRVDELLAKKNQYPLWLTLIFFGLAAAAVTPYAFGGNWPDVPISFLLSVIVGYFQIVIAPRSTLYSNVFEVSSSIFVSFMGRVVGSIGKKQDIFCFSGITQGSLALILPGYIILCGSLELQSKNIVAGSVRMFYAIIYSLFLGFGVTMGSAIYGWIDSNATSETTCQKTVGDYWKILLVPAFTVFVASVNQASLRQLPIMAIISSAGYTVTFFTNKRVHDSTEFTSAIGAFVIGVLGNLYSRVGHGLAFAAMLPGILVQVPSGLASQGSIVSGIHNADQIVSNGTKPKTVTQTDAAGSPIATAVIQPTQSAADSTEAGGSVLTLGMGMVQVSIGITVGLFIATLVIYPFGKKRSGLFTF